MKEKLVKVSKSILLLCNGRLFTHDRNFHIPEKKKIYIYIYIYIFVYHVLIDGVVWCNPLILLTH